MGSVSDTATGRLLSGIAIGIILGCSGPPDKPDSAQAVPPGLPRLQVEALHDAARVDIEAALLQAQRNPADAAASGRLGMILHAYKQYESAAACYERAHVLAAGEFRWAYYLGTARFLLGQDQAAEASLRKALALDPRYLPARIKLAKILFSRGDNAGSEREYRSALEQAPRSALAHYGLGRAIASRDGVQAAIKHYRSAIKLLPGFGAAHYSLAQAYRSSGDHKKAKAHFELFQENNSGEDLQDPLLREVSSLARAPSNHHYLQGLALAEAGDIAAAVNEFEKALVVDPSLIEAHVNLVSLYGGLGRPEDVARHYNAAAERNPDRADLHYNYGVFQAERTRYPEGEKAFRRAIQADPSFAEAHSNLGQMLEAQRRMKEAEEQYRLAVQHRPTYRLAHFHLGRILFGRGETGEGLKHFLKTLTPEDAETPKYMLDVAVAYARAGDPANARRYALQARERASDLGQGEVVSISDQIIKKLGGQSR